VTQSRRTSKTTKKIKELISMKSATTLGVTMRACLTWSTDSTKSSAMITNKLIKVPSLMKLQYRHNLS